jgi:hypothetical protein
MSFRAGFSPTKNITVLLALAPADMDPILHENDAQD